MRVFIRFLLHAGLMVLLPACAPLPQPVVAPPAPPGPAQPPAPQAQTEGTPAPSAVPVPPPPVAAPLLLEDYRRQLAGHIVQANAAQVFAGAPPPMLRSVVVLTLRMDAGGRLLQARVLRGNGQRELEQRALHSVAQAAPLPAPGSLAGRRGELELNETWLFRDDGQFQLRTLAEPQSAGG